MEGVVVGSIIGATIQVVLQNLLTLCVEEIKHIRNFKEDLEKLRESFLMVKDFLDDAEMQQSNNKAVKRWLNKLEAAVFDADNVLDELNYQALCNKIERQNKMKTNVGSPVKNKVIGCNKVVPRLRVGFNYPTSTLKMAQKIRNITENVMSINREARGFDLKTHAPGVGSDAPASREKTSWSKDANIVLGREKDVNMIVEKVTIYPTKKPFSVIPIVGMGGLGKTTLARLAFHDEKIKNHFGKLIWVYVSENFDPKTLFRKILESLTGEKFDLDTDEALLGKIEQNLEGKRYLLVLDDVWNEEMDKWTHFIRSLLGVNTFMGNGVIVTTRSQRVASIVETVGSLQLSNLTNENCWSIIKENAFLEGNITSEFEMIGKKMAERCQGLPLAAQVVGSMFKGKSRDKWHSIAERMLSKSGNDVNIVMKILKLSYDNLPSPSLKKCFAYCSIFPKGTVLKRVLLVCHWLSEGFLESDQGTNGETLGNEYLDLLLQKSLLQPVREDVRMHDHQADPVRYVYTRSISSIPKAEQRDLRSLIFEGKVSNNMFSDLKCLRGLVLIGNENEKLPKIEHLIHLRYLDILRTSIKSLPKWVGNLYHLQTLRACNCLKELPQILKNLINIRHLHIEGEGTKTQGIPMLGHLPHLKSLFLKNLPNVRCIGSLLDGIRDSNGDDKIIVFPALESLCLSTLSDLSELLQTAGETQTAREVVAFPRLEHLMISYCHQLTSVPCHFPCLEELKISWMNNYLLEHLLADLTTLTKLNIVGVKRLVSLPDSFFCRNQNLSSLSIYCCQELELVAPCLQGGGASLTEFEIYNCRSLVKLPNDLHCLNSLEKLGIQCYPSLKSIPYDPSDGEQESVHGLTSLRILIIKDCRGLTAVPSRMLESCASSLEAVDLSGLTSVKNMGTVIGCLQKMPHLTGHKMPHLTGLSLDPDVPAFAYNGPSGSSRDLYHGPAFSYNEPTRSLRDLHLLAASDPMAIPDSWTV